MTSRISEQEVQEMREILEARRRNHKVIDAIYGCMKVDESYRRAREGKTVLVYNESVCGWYNSRRSAMEGLEKRGLSETEARKAVVQVMVQDLVAN